MTPQKITVKIPRKQGEMIPFDIDKWNTGEYEAIHKAMGVTRVLCIDNKGSFPVVVAYLDGNISSYTANGKCYPYEEQPQLFIRKKSEGELPIDEYKYLYQEGGLGKASFNYIDDILGRDNKSAVGIVRITYAWED